MFDRLKNIHSRPKPFEFYTTEELWTDEHISRKMLEFHLNEQLDISSRKHTFIDTSVDWIVSYFDIGPASEIADFGCGPGLYTCRLAKTGSDVTGIDFSKYSIAYAREQATKENLSIRYINQNYVEFESKRQFDLILMIMCDYCALSPEQREIMLRKFFRFLKTGGSVLLDVYSSKAYQKRKELSHYEENLQNGFWSASTYFGFANTFKYEKQKVVLDKYTIIEPDRERTFYNWLQYFDKEDLQKEFTKCGFVDIEFYSDVAGTPFDKNYDEFAIVATKP